jgi:urease accessory protein
MPQIEPVTVREAPASDAPASDAPASHWHASLDLAFERRAGGTVLARNQHRGPLQVQKALYPEGRGTCHIAVLHPPGGIAASDRLCIRASLQEGSRALLTTPGATKWYRSEGEWARQDVNLSVGCDSILEWFPRENILFDGSKIASSLEVALSPQAKYFGWEILCFGRRASGESWNRGNFRLRTSIRRDDRLLWSEIANVDAGTGFARSAVGLANFTVSGTFVVAGDAVEADLLAQCRGTAPAGVRVQYGITCVPDVWIARYLGDSAEEVFAWFTDLWEILRPALTGRAPCAPRVWNC